jgi:pyruvate kinase
VRSSLAAKRRR